MSRRQKTPLRTLTNEERVWLEEISRAQSQPASHVARAPARAAHSAGQRSTNGGLRVK
jgi:hypothetical protein